MYDTEMKNFIGAKVIKAKLSTMSEFKKRKYGDNADIKAEDLYEEVYIVVYPPEKPEGKPYLSMSPKEVFERCYRLIEESESFFMSASIF
jgi:hypothetical protein